MEPSPYSPQSVSGCPSGIPDDLYTLPQLTGTVLDIHLNLHEHTISFLGSSDYKKTLDVSAWSFCYTNLACRPLPFYPPEFKEAATVIMQEDLHMTKDDINVANAKIVYLHLINAFESF